MVHCTVQTQPVVLRTNHLVIIMASPSSWEGWICIRVRQTFRKHHRYPRKVPGSLVSVGESPGTIADTPSSVVKPPEITTTIKELSPTVPEWSPTRSDSVGDTFDTFGGIGDTTGTVNDISSSVADASRSVENVARILRTIVDPPPLEDGVSVGENP